MDGVFSMNEWDLSLRDPQLIFVCISEKQTPLTLSVSDVRHPYDMCQTSVPIFFKYISKLQHTFTLLRHFYGDLKMCRSSDVQYKGWKVKFDEVIIFNFLVEIFTTVEKPRKMIPFPLVIYNQTSFCCSDTISFWTHKMKRK